MSYILNKLYAYQKDDISILLEWQLLGFIKAQLC